MNAAENPPAFPSDIEIPHPGMSLRDWFAGQALPVIIADLAQDRNDDLPVEDMPRLSAKGAYRYADAMLAERAKVQP